MKTEYLNMGFNQLSFDEFTWSDNSRVSSSDKFFVSIPLSSEQLNILSKTVYHKYLEVIKYVPDYFERWNEPFPANEVDIYNNPESLMVCFSKSALWSGFLINAISKIQNWNMDQAKYHVLTVNDVKLINNVRITMTCFELKS
jgi:RAB protein geranylgeranyltransferase component A